MWRQSHPSQGSLTPQFSKVGRSLEKDPEACVLDRISELDQNLGIAYQGDFFS